jgi:hypothetical protein
VAAVNHRRAAGVGQRVRICRVHLIMRTNAVYNSADVGSEVVGVRLAVARLLEGFMREDHPTDRLVATVEGPVPASVANSMRVLSQQLAGRRPWVLGPPELFDESDARDGRSLGFVLSIYTARPPWDKRMDPAIDRAHLNEAKELLGEICRISGELHVSFDVDFAGESIGTVEEGRLDESLEIGLIGEWERVLNEQDL